MVVELLAQDDGRAFVRGALGDGDRIVAAGLDRIVPGQRVRALDAGAGP